MEAVTALKVAADALFKFLGSDFVIKELYSIWENDKEIELLAETVQHIRDVLFDVQRRQIEDRSVIKCYQRLRALFLDAEDFLDKVQTLKKKKDAEASRIKEAEEEIVKPDGKGKRSLAYCRVKMEPLKNTARRFFSSSSNQAKYALEVHNAIKEIRRNFEAITRDIRSFPLLGNEPINRSERALTADRARTCIVNASEIIGRDGDKDKVVELLLRPSVDEREISVVSVVGMGGMGKTTVAQLVYDDKSWQKKCQFDNNRFWVSDSKKYDLESLLKHILKSIDPKDTSLDKLGEDHLSNRFVDEIQGKSFLLVLDDVDCEDGSNWENLMKLLKKGNKEKSRVLVTTRSRKVAGVVGSLSASTYELEGLSQEDSLELFERYASPKRRDGILDEIVKKCCGVPLALKVIGSLLREADAVEWENVRKSKSLADIVDEPYETNKLIRILKISYDDLDATTKQCFSFCALFPKNYIIPKETLSSIWMANIHFEINKGETLEYVCDKKLRILYNRCFLEAENMNDVPFDGFGEATHVKMHDLMYDLARDVAGEEIFVVAADLEGDNFIVEGKVRHLFLAKKTTGTLQLKRKERLRSILTYPGEREMLLSVILSEFPALRMLDICSCRNDNLPRSVGRLIHLRYLCLFDNDFQTLPDSICELINLKHLRLCHCRALTQMPSRMGALASLQVLYIDCCHKLEELPSSIVNLVNLRQLFLKSCHSLRNLPSRMDALTSLRLLDIYHCLHLEPQSCIGNMVNLKKFKCTAYRGGPLPFGVGALTSLELLSLDCTGQIELPRGIQKLNNLRKLSLQFYERLVRMPSGMGALLSICHPALFVVGDPDSSYAQLEELLPLSNFPADLKIRICKNYKLKTPIGDGEPFLSNKKSLRKLQIMFELDCMSRSTIDEWNETEEVLCHRDILEKLEPPPNLEKFELCGYKCMTFPPWVRQHDFASGLENLVELFLNNCNQVRYLPFMRTLKSLERLGLDVLDSLEYIEENVSATVFCLPRLKSLSLMDLPKFRGWCGGLLDGVNEDDSELIRLMRPPSFPCLSDVKIEECSSFREPFHLLLSLNISNFKNGSGFGSTIASIDGDVSDLCLQKTNDSLELSIDAHRVTPRYMVETFRAMSGHLAFLHLYVNSGFKTLPGLQHLTALRVLEINSCHDFTWEEEEEEEMQSARDDEIQSTSLHTAHHRHVSWTGLTSLESLTLERLPRMVRLPEGIQFLPSLKKLDICYCVNLQIPEWLQETFECREEVKMWSKHFHCVKKETDAATPPRLSKQLC